MSQSKQLRYAMGVNQILCLDSGSHGKSLIELTPT